MRWPLTKCASGTASGAARPGSASFADGIADFLRNSAMYFTVKENGKESVGTHGCQLKPLVLPDFAS